jgi:hypothetical protein
MDCDTTHPQRSRFNGSKSPIDDNGLNEDIDDAPRWIVRLLAMCCLGLIPWTIGLAVTLPRSYLVANWPLAWTGFDVILLGCLATTAWALHKRRRVALPASTITSALLLCDAWFDILTSHDGLCRTVSLITAIVAEIPLALLLGLISRRLLRASAGVGPGPAISTAQLSMWRTPVAIITKSPLWLMPSGDTNVAIERTHRVATVTSFQGKSNR